MSRRPLRSTRRTTLAVLTLAAALFAGSAVSAGAAVAGTSDKGSGGGGGSSRTSGDRSPLFDFTDAYYRAGGVDPTQLVGRRSGTDGISVPATAPDSDHRGVRSLLTLPAYDTSGGEWFFTVMADLGPTAFTNNAAGRAAKALADSAKVYVFPTKDGDQLGVGNNRQADMIDLSGGYFSNNPLGLWLHVWVSYTPKAYNTAAGQKALADLAAKNGTALDGTPIITSVSDITSLTQKGFVAQNTRPQTQEGRYFVCPVFKDPRRGAITPDAFLANVKRADGTPLPAEQRFARDFVSLQTTGEYAN